MKNVFKCVIKGSSYWMHILRPKRCKQLGVKTIDSLS